MGTYGMKRGARGVLERKAFSSLIASYLEIASHLSDLELEVV